MPRQTYCPLEKARETWSLRILLEGIKKCLTIQTSRTWGWKLPRMINDCILSEVRPSEHKPADAVKRASSHCDKAHSGKATKKKITAINTDQNENRMKVSAKLVFTSAVMDYLLGAGISTICRSRTLNMGVQAGQKFNWNYSRSLTFTRVNTASRTCQLLP